MSGHRENDTPISLSVSWSSGMWGAKARGFSKVDYAA